MRSVQDLRLIHAGRSLAAVLLQTQRVLSPTGRDALRGQNVCLIARPASPAPAYLFSPQPFSAFVSRFDSHDHSHDVLRHLVRALQVPKEYGVHEVLSNALALKGLETVDDFAYTFPELPNLDSVQGNLSDSDMSDMGSSDPLHRVHAAKIRRVPQPTPTLPSASRKPPQPPGWRICPPK